MALARIHQLARAEGVPLSIAAARILDTDELTPQARRSLGNFVADVARWRDITNSSPRLLGAGARPAEPGGGGVDEPLPNPELAQIILDASGYTATRQADRSAYSAGRLENLTALHSRTDRQTLRKGKK